MVWSNFIEKLFIHLNTYMFICWYLTLIGDNKEIKMSEEKPIPNSVKFAIGGLSGFVLDYSFFF